MSDDTNTNEWIEWIEEAVSKQHIKYYEYKHFHNIEAIGSGGFGEVFRANWKHHPHYFALKSFFKFNDATYKEVVQELKLQREVDFHENIIRFCGITKDKNYILVMEYADGGTLRKYLSKNFSNLTWDDKFNLALQLVYAVSCLHDEGIVHRDLHSGNVLVSKNTIKLADFGLSRRIETSSNISSKLCGLLPYIDPKKFSSSQYKLNEKSDVYSVGVLLWEISSGKRPFQTEEYEISLALNILQGSREEPVPGSPDDYVKLYTECWNEEPYNRPTIGDIVVRLKAFLPNDPIENDQTDNLDDITHDNTAVYEQQNSNSTNSTIAEIKNSGVSYSGVSSIVWKTNEVMECFNEKIPLNVIVDEILKNIFKKLNEGKDLKEYILDDCCKNYNISSQEIYDWLLNNQNDSNSIFLLGNFNYSGIGTDVNKESAFELYEKAANLGNNIAQYNLAQMYKIGEGVNENHKKAFELFEESSKGEFLNGIFMYGYFYSNGIGTNVNKQKAFELYEKAANLGHNGAQRNLALMYKKGEGVDKNYNKASELFKQFYKTHLLCNSSFLHKSLLDYFVVRDIYDDVNETDETQQVFLKVDDTLNKLKLLGEQSVIQFLAERVQEEPTFRNQLHEFINRSKTDESFQNVAANAITVLVKAGVQFNGADLNRIRVPGADLSYGIFDHAQFQGADLSKVNLQGAWIREVDFNHANMTGIEFGENPFIILENLNTNTHDADHDGISCYFSQDGQLLVGAIRDTIILYNAETFEEIWKSCGELDKYARVNDLSWKPSVSISQNGSLIAMGRWDNTISLWINKNERPLTFNFIGHTDKIYCVSISPNDEFIASGSRDCTVCLWSIREKRLLHIFKEHEDDVNSVSFSPNSKLIVSGSVDNMVYLWSVNKKKLVHAFEGHRYGVKSVSFSPDGEFIVSGSKDGMVCLWSVNEEKLLHTLQVSTDEISSILFSPNGEYIISGSWDRTISLWSVKEKKLVHKFYGHTDRVTSVSSNSEFIASGSFDGQIRLWSIKDNEKFTHSLGRALINDDSISPNEDWIVDCFDLLRGSHVSDWSASSPDGKFIAKAKEQYIHLYSREKDLICTLEAEEQPDWKFNCISISPDSEFIAAGPWIENGLWGNYYDIKLFSVTDRELIHTFRSHQWQINCVSFSPDGELLASGSWDNTMRLWSLKEKKLLATFDHSSFGHERSCIECISFSPDSKFVITGGWNYTVALWSIENIERPQEIFDEHKNIIYDVKFSPDGKLIASASRDSTVRIWSALSGNKSLAIIRGFIGNVSHLAWNATPEGLFLHTISNEIIGNEDKFYRYWKIEQDGRKLRVKLQWAPYQSALTASDAHIQNINGLSPMNEKFLIQLGAKRKP